MRNRKRGVKPIDVTGKTLQKVIQKIEHTVTAEEVYTEMCFRLGGSCLHIWAIRNLLKHTLKINKGAFQSLILRAAAVVLDAKYYTDNIRRCTYVWVVDTTNGKIVVIPTANIRNNSWQYFAAFRTQEDAILAVKLLKEFKDYYGKQKG